MEPGLQPLSGERFRHRTAIREDGARLDVAASGVWGGRFERTYFNVRVFNPLASSCQAHSLSATYAKHEGEKRRHYEDHVREIEQLVRPSQLTGRLAERRDVRPLGCLGQFDCQLYHPNAWGHCRVSLSACA